MTSEEAAAIKIGDRITNLRGDEHGVATQTAPSWFMVTWDDGSPEIILRMANRYLLCARS